MIVEEWWSNVYFNVAIFYIYQVIVERKAQL